MRDSISLITSVLLSVGAVASSRADSTWEYSVQVSAAVKAAPAQITLSWPQDTLGAPNSYTVYRKSETGTAWGQGTALPGTATSYTDTSVKAGTAYEYEVVKSASQYTGYGYVYAGINLPMTDSRGKLLLVVDDTYAVDLTGELARLQQDLAGDGWTVVRLDVHRTDSVTSVKSLIKSHYKADPKEVKGVFLFGHVPVPYSGDIVPDGHVPDHQGAWPADGFYGDMDGVWTDSTVNDTSGYYERNHNVPGDGKFDQSAFPAPLKLMVGRVDLANMPGRLTSGGPATFPSELELLRNYLNKDHNFRTKQFDLPRRGIVGDYFGSRNGEAFAASGWRNFAPFVGAENVTTLPNQGTWLSTLSSNPYLWAYGCGAGSFSSIGGIGTSGQYSDGTTTDLVQADIKAVFTLVFGSWLGDWDSEDNIMRGVLACQSYGLTSAWSGRPHWYLHRMAMGEPIGFGALLTQNNGAQGLYHTEINSAAGQIHIALMGDPTLRMHVVAPPANLKRAGKGKSANLTWAASSDSVLGYHVYRATKPSGPFKRLTTAPITATHYVDHGSSGAATYMVRAVKLETSASGTYYNPSQGAFVATKDLEVAASGPTGSPDGQPEDDTTNSAPSVSSASSVSTNSLNWVTNTPPAGTNTPFTDTGAHILPAAPSEAAPGGTAPVVPNSEFSYGNTASASSSTDKSQALDTNESATGPTAQQGVSVVDYTTPELPAVGDSTLHVLTPSLLELKLINTKQLDPARVGQWDFVDGGGNFIAPPASAFSVTVNGQPVAVTAVGFKRRPLYAPLTKYDLRVDNSLYLQLAAPVADEQEVEVTNPDGSLWSAASMKFSTVVDPLRYSPAIHVNQEGYLPKFSKKAMVGYYAGSFGELLIPTTGGFKLVNAANGKTAFKGQLVQRKDSGYTYSPTPYQNVYEADFTSFKGNGEYRLVVPGMGASLPFLVDHGVAMSFARGYALGLYHQRCGTGTAMPYTRFTHDKCHTGPVAVPSSADAFPFTWGKIAEYANTLNANNPPQSAPALTSPSAMLFPFVNQGPLEVSGGHHDAGDYSKYTINSASLIHYLMFAVDSLDGVASFDNMGIPESGDGISDVMQEAKWEADYLAKMQDSDGGFYFLVYPQGREYEGNVTPDHGDPQLVWPKTTSVTAASVAALAQCASSPAFKKAYPQVAKVYLQKAKLGWQFLMNAISKYGKNGAYQKITHYGDDFADNDELAWAACQMYLATGDDSIHKLLLSWFNPADPATWRWGWIHMSQCYGHTIRSYAFALKTHRVASAKALDATFLANCEAEIATAGDDVLSWSQANAYGTSFPPQTKAVNAAGWYFSADQAFDMAVAYQLNAKPGYLDAMLENMNYEGGCNPANVSYVTGLGWKKSRDIVSQWHVNDKRTLPPSGLPSGNIQDGFSYLNTYGPELGGLCFPSDSASAPTPFYDRWGDSWNVTTEMVVLNSGRALGTLGFLAAKAGGNTGHWKPSAAKIKVPGSAKVGSSVTVSLQGSKVNLGGARITWEARDQEPTYGSTFTFSPKNSGPQWVEAEAQMPDGRRVFAQGSFNAE
jgi:hypothetical protein